MSRSITIGAIALILLPIIYAFTLAEGTTGARTEQYAIVDVLEFGKKKRIRVSVDDKPAIEKEWKTEKTEDLGDFAPVLQELNELNAQGFEIVNASVTYTTVGGGTVATYGSPRHTFLMRRKL